MKNFVISIDKHKIKKRQKTKQNCKTILENQVNGTGGERERTLRKNREEKQRGRPGRTEHKRITHLSCVSGGFRLK